MGKNISDKIILVFYIAVGQMPNEEVLNYVKQIKKNLNAEEYDDLYNLMIPVRNEPHSKVECINPKFISSDSEHAKRIEKIISEAEEKLNNFNIE